MNKDQVYIYLTMCDAYTSKHIMKHAT